MYHFWQRENKQFRDTVLRLEEENCNLAQEVVESKVELRSQMDKVRRSLERVCMHGQQVEKFISLSRSQ